MGECKARWAGYVAVGCPDAITKLIPVLQVGGRPGDGVFGRPRTQEKTGSGLCASLQHRWVAAILLCVDGAFWEVGAWGWKEASVGAVGRLHLRPGDQTPEA